MKKKWVGFLVLSSVALTLQGCAHGGLNKRLDEKLAQEDSVKNRADLRAEATHLIDADSALSADQKSKLASLRESTHAKNDEISAKSLRLRSVLIKDLVSSKYDEDEVDLIKRRLKDLENQRLSVLFNAVESANTILGRQAAANLRIVHQFFEMRGHSEGYERR